jgi:hypothetical protein
MPKSMKSDSKLKSMFKTTKNKNSKNKKKLKKVRFSLTLSQSMESMKVMKKKYPKSPKNPTITKTDDWVPLTDKEVSIISQKYFNNVKFDEEVDEKAEKAFNLWCMEVGKKN